MQQQFELEKLELNLKESKSKKIKKIFTRPFKVLKSKLSKLKISFSKYK